MQPAASNISLSYDQVRSILEEWLNANLLRTSHQVVDIDYVTDRVGELQFNQFNIGLSPTPTPPPGMFPVAGHSGNGARPAEEVQSAQPAEAPKKRSRTTRIPDETRLEIVKERQKGIHPKVIAEAHGISYASVYEIMAEYRRTAAEPAHGD